MRFGNFIILAGCFVCTFTLFGLVESLDDLAFFILGIGVGSLIFGGVLLSVKKENKK